MPKYKFVSIVPHTRLSELFMKTNVADASSDQPLPIKSDSPCIQDLVVKDIQERKAVGIERYGTTLQAHNGRDALLDAYQEALDLCCYLRQALYEQHGA